MRLFPAQPPPNRLQISERSCEIYPNTDKGERRTSIPKCRRKMRMSGLRQVEMSAFMDGRGPYGNGANHVEPTRTGPIESVARGKAEASFAGRSSGAAEGKCPPGATDAAPPSRTRG